MLIPAFRNADASRAAFPHTDQTAGWQTIMQPWQTPALGAARAFQGEPASTGWGKKPGAAPAMLTAATGQTCLLVLYPDGEPKRRICQAPAVLFYPRSRATAGV